MSIDSARVFCTGCDYETREVYRPVRIRYQMANGKTIETGRSKGWCFDCSGYSDIEKIDEENLREDLVSKERERREQEKKQSRRDKFRERETEFEKANADYRQVARAEHLPITEGLAEVLMDLDEGPELLCDLGKDIERAGLLSQLPPHIAAFKLGEQLANKRAEAKAKAAALEAAQREKAVSNAPPPAPKIDGGNAQVEKDPADMTDKEFATWRKRQIAQRR